MTYSYELKYHFYPKKGWMNDPNGLVFFDGYYHAFFQHARNVERPFHDPMTWGHARTKDFLHWEELPLALDADQPYDCGGCWSGTAIVHDGVLYLFYASVLKTENGYSQNVSMAWSRDGIHFEKSPANPIIPTYPADGSADFRDPAVMRDGDTFYLVMASANPEKNTANLLLYKSENLTEWTYVGVLHEWCGGQGDNAVKMLYCECPSFMKYGDQYLLTASVAEKDRHYFMAMVGDFDGETFTPEVSGNVHCGPDQYAGQVFLDERGRCVMLTWVPGWGYKYRDLEQKSIGCLSLPIELVVRDGKIYGEVLEEVKHLLQSENPNLTRTENGFIIHREGLKDVVFEGKVDELAVLQDEYLIEVYVNGGQQIICAVLCSCEGVKK